VDDPRKVTVVPDSAVPQAARTTALTDLPGSRRSRSLAVAAIVGIPVSSVFLILAIRGADLGAVWRIVQDVRPWPLAAAVACMPLVYFCQAARWRRIAGTSHGQLRFFEMVVSGLAVNNVLPGRVGDLLRARWVARGAFTGGRGLATVVIDRGFDIAALATFLLVTLPFVTDEGWVDRIVVGTFLLLAALVGCVAASRAYARRRAYERRVQRGLVRRFVRDTIDGLSDPMSATARPWELVLLSVVAWLVWALAATLAARSVGVELSVVEALFVTAALNLGVAIPSSPGFVGTYQWLGVSTLALFDVSRETGLAFAIVMQAVWFVPTTLGGAAILASRGFRAWRPGGGYSSPRGR
jgi:glycosyltransferase 2 family protein